MEEMHLFATGLVQGVGFRAAVKWRAAEHQIKGYVRNLPDGRVEIVAQGSKSQLSAFADQIRSSPGAGRVDHLEVSHRTAARPYDSFQVL